MKLCTLLDYASDPLTQARQVQALEKAGLDMAWVPEAYTYDAPSQLGYLAACTETIELGSGILPLYSRTPALTAMTAASLDALSGGRFTLGLGASGPQVIEGWHGVPYTAPVGRTREVIEICRMVWRREPLAYEGRYYRLPLPAEQGTGLGKPLKLINRPVREAIPIYVASLGPKNVALTAELAEGWLPVFFHPEKVNDVWGSALAEGLKRRSPDLGPLQIVAGGLAAICSMEEAPAIRDRARAHYALYIGGMGAPGRNFYNDLLAHYGYEEAAATIQDRYLAGDRAGAAEAVPAGFLADTTLVGDEGYVRDRIETFRAAGVTHLNVLPAGPDPLETVRRLKELSA